MFRLKDDRIIAPSTGDRRRCAAAILRIGERYGLLFFSVPGTHGHAALICSEAEAGQFANALATALRHALAPGIGFEPHRRRPIERQQHLRRLRSYVFDNARKHGTLVDPYFEASSLPDLLGLRLTGAYTRKRVRERLPSLTRADLLAHLGLTSLGEGGDLRELADAAAAAIAEPNLRGRRPTIVRARIAAVRLGVELDARQSWLAERLGVTDRAIRKLAARPSDPWLVRAIAHQLWLRDHISVRPERNPATARR